MAASSARAGVLIPRRGGRWSLLAAANAVGVSHRTARTVDSRTPGLDFPIGTQDLLTLKVLGEILLATPPAQSDKRLADGIVRSRDMQAMALARQVWDGDALDSWLIVTPAAVVLAPNLEDTPDLIRDLSRDHLVNLLPIGEWARALKNALVE